MKDIIQAHQAGPYVKRIHRWIFVIATLFIHATSGVMIMTDVVEQTWLEYSISVSLTTPIMFYMNWMFIQGPNAWPAWDDDFIHIPLSTAACIIGSWFLLCPEVLEATFCIWVGWFSVVNGRIKNFTYGLYTLPLIILYLYLSSSDWSMEPNTQAQDIAFAIAIAALSAYLGIYAEMERSLDINRKLTESRLLATRERLSYLANHDDLTGLLNRRGLFHTIGSGPHKDLALIMLDVDNFKRLNDNYGHPMGDKCLVALGAAINRVVSPDSPCARVGGEEFLLVLEGSSESDAMRLAKVLQNEISTLSLADDNAKYIQFTASLGVIFCPGSSCNFYHVWSQADKLLYSAKEAGPNGFAFEST